MTMPRRHTARRQLSERLRFPGSDLLGVNEWQGGQCWPLVQLTGLLRSYEVGAGCPERLLYLPAVPSPLGPRTAATGLPHSQTPLKSGFMYLAPPLWPLAV